LRLFSDQFGFVWILWQVSGVLSSNAPTPADRMGGDMSRNKYNRTLPFFCFFLYNYWKLFLGKNTNSKYKSNIPTFLWKPIIRKLDF